MSDHALRDQHLVIADSVIRHLALDEADLRGRVAELESDVHIYREIATEAIHALAEATRDRDRQRDERIGVITENRHVREQLTRLQAAHTTLVEALRQCRAGRAA